MLIKNGLVLTESGFEKLTILTDGGKISGILPADAMVKYSGEVLDAAGNYVLPALTDVHFHGCAGHDFCEGTAEAFSKIAEYEFSQGVGTICPATMTLPDETLTAILKSAAAYAKVQPKSGAAKLVGVHLEGPFISRAKAGAQNAAHIQPPSAEKLKHWQAAAEGLIRLVTIAPEIEGSAECIRACAGDMRFSLGHTQCGYDEAAAAFEAGADHVTHLYNAMPPFTHRSPALIGAAADRSFDGKRVYAEVICDGVHLSKSAVRAAFSLFGADGVVLISDSMEATGMPDGEYQLGGQKVIKRGSHATLEDGTLAGSVTSLYGCLLKAVEYGIPLETAAKAATVNPCRSVGIDGFYGSIEVGKAARFLLLDISDLSIRKVI